MRTSQILLIINSYHTKRQIHFLTLYLKPDFFIRLFRCFCLIPVSSMSPNNENSLFWIESIGRNRIMCQGKRVHKICGFRVRQYSKSLCLLTIFRGRYHEEERSFYLQRSYWQLGINGGRQGLIITAKILATNPFSAFQEDCSAGQCDLALPL